MKNKQKWAFTVTCYVLLQNNYKKNTHLRLPFPESFKFTHFPWCGHPHTGRFFVLTSRAKRRNVPVLGLQELRLFGEDERYPTKSRSYQAWTDNKSYFLLLRGKAIAACLGLKWWHLVKAGGTCRPSAGSRRFGWQLVEMWGSIWSESLEAVF